MKLAEARVRIPAVYLLVQALGVPIWWSLLALKPEWRPLFFADGVQESVLLKFLIPDVVVLGGSSLVAGLAQLGRKPWANHAVWVAVGANVYALLGALAVNWPIGSRPVSDGIMCVSVIGTLLAAREVAKE